MEKLNMKAILSIVYLMEMGNIFQKMVNIIQGNGKIVINMEKEHFIIQMEKLNMKVIGLMM